MARRGSTHIEELSINNKISNDIYEVEESAKCHFGQVYNVSDCFQGGDVEHFMHLRCISDSTRRQLGKDFSLIEIMKTFDRLNSKKA